MKEEYIFLDTNILIRKAHKKWQKILAWIVSIPVKISLVIGLIYLGIALLFGLMAIVMFIGDLFTGETDRALSLLAFYTPFFILLLFGFIFRNKERVFLALLFIISNLLFYVVPIMYGAYYLRYNYLERKLQTAKYDRCYDKYCNDKISAYKNRKALFSVSSNNRIVANDHVGHSWSFSNYFNGVSLRNGTIYMWIAEDDTIEIASYAAESDVYMDFGRNITRFKVPWYDLIDHRVYLSHNVVVWENHGKFTGNICVIASKYSISLVTVSNMDLSMKKEDFRIPNDSVMKYFFKFQKIYKKQYDRDEYPWERYMSEEDVENEERHMQEIHQGSLENDGGSRYRIDD